MIIQFTGVKLFDIKTIVFPTTMSCPINRIYTLDEVYGWDNSSILKATKDWWGLIPPRNIVVNKLPDSQPLIEGSVELSEKSNEVDISFLVPYSLLDDVKKMDGQRFVVALEAEGIDTYYGNIEEGLRLEYSINNKNKVLHAVQISLSGINRL